MGCAAAAARDVPVVSVRALPDLLAACRQGASLVIVDLDSRLPTSEAMAAVRAEPALAAEPNMLLLDEPMAGMNVEEKQDMCRFILDVNEQFGTTIVLIEHDMGVVMDISDRVVVLDYGKKIGDGTPDEVRNNQEVINAYLGVAH